MGLSYRQAASRAPSPGRRPLATLGRRCGLGCAISTSEIPAPNIPGSANVAAQNATEKRFEMTLYTSSEQIAHDATKNNTYHREDHDAHFVFQSEPRIINFLQKKQKNYFKTTYQCSNRNNNPRNSNDYPQELSRR